MFKNENIEKILNWRDNNKINELNYKVRNQMEVKNITITEKCIKSTVSLGEIMLERWKPWKEDLKKVS